MNAYGSPWLAACEQFAVEQGLRDDAAAVLRAFPARSPDSLLRLPGGADFEAIERAAGAALPDLTQEIVVRLSDEVDPAQAAMFARRFDQVAVLLGRLEPAEARLLRVGLIARMGEILAAPHPRALRVRAAADYFYSRGAVLRYRDPGRPSAEDAIADPAWRASSWRAVAPGIEHALLDGRYRDGPVHVNLLRMRGVRMDAIDCRPLGADLAAVARELDAPAAISGGYFLYSESDIAPPSRRGDPVGLLVRDGRVLNPPAFRRATLGQGGAAESPWIRVVDAVGAGVRVGDVELEIGAVNAPKALGRVPVAFNRAWGRIGPEFAGISLAIVGEGLVGEVLGGAAEIPLAGYLLCVPAGTPLPEPPRPAVEHRLPDAPRAAMAGGPMLLREGEVSMSLEAEDFAGSAPPVTFSTDETFDQNLLPRMAVGLDRDGVLYAAAVDGRNFDRAPGLTLRGTARLLRALGCVTAMNLDGGSSKRMAVNGRVVDLPSTEVVGGDAEVAARVRPVRSALLFYSNSTS